MLISTLFTIFGTMKLYHFTYFSILVGLIFSLTACVNEPQRTNSTENQLEENNSAISSQESRNKIVRIQKIFYTLPSPLELTYLFKKEGIEYQQEKLHDITRRSDYNLTVKKALNLGIYGADLSYAGLFGKHQAAIEYYTTTQLMAEDLGIGQTFQKEFISRLEQNANNKDTLLQVISEFFLDNDSYLKNQQQQDISTYILAGGWIEGLYLGTEMADTKANSDGIREIITGQRFSLDNLIILLESLSSKEGSEELLTAVKRIDNHFKNAPQTESKNETSATKKDGVLKINSQADPFVLNDSSFALIKQEVAAIRTKIIE